jgi:antitoxin (DNA-binding transcriptional repressor) of toxin-antitoxin stability system
MIEKTISVTEAARNFADCVNRAHYQGVTFILHKNGAPVARILPEEKKKPSTGREIAAALAKIRLSPQESAAWHGDLAAARNGLISQKDKWQ